jgi:hypothetical protein
MAKGKGCEMERKGGGGAYGGQSSGSKAYGDGSKVGFQDPGSGLGSGSKVTGAGGEGGSGKGSVKR